MKILLCICVFLSSLCYSIQKNSLLHHAKIIHSQYGEEGILDAILERLNIHDGFFVEFGGWDAAYLSNTRFLAERGWGGVFIEADGTLLEQARKNCQNFPKVQCLNEFVTWNSARSKGKTFDQIADQSFPNQEIDVLSIDIDGPDYLILESLKRKPKIILIEGGFSWSPSLTARVPDSIAKTDSLNQSLSTIFKIAKKKGYIPVCFTINTFLVREDLAAPFADIKNDPETLWLDSWYYFSEKAPYLIEFTRNLRATHPLIKLYDNFPTP